MIKSIRFWVAVVLLAVLAGCIMMKYVSHSAQQSAPERSQTPNQSVTVSTTGTVHEDPVHNSEVTGIPEETENDHTEESEYDASVPFITEQKIIEITNKMQEVSLYSTDLIGWIYIADSDIDYPVVKSRDNQYYLYHSPDGRENRAGSIFLSYHCSPDLSDALNIVYGHDMQYGMFTEIREFRQREQFDKHRYGWLFTKEDLYLIDFFALSIVSAYDEIYDFPSDRSKWQECLKANSVNYIEPELKDDDSVVVLSTCAYDFENARALFAGKLIRKQKLNTGTTARSS